MQAQQHTSHLLMIRPVRFGFNAETAVNNSFQLDKQDWQLQEKAVREFDELVATLRAHDIDVTVVNDTPEPHTPDSIFPNNWISFHNNGHVYLYPMFAGNRRLERKSHVLDAVNSKFLVSESIDLTANESAGRFLEGTGSMVLDRENRIAYACRSPRTDEQVLAEFCKRESFRPVLFTATDANGGLIYHTNVMMCVADTYAVVCMDSIKDAGEKERLAAFLQSSGKELIYITPGQMNHFAGNMLQVHNLHGQRFLVMSTQAYNSLGEEQLVRLTAHNPIIHSDITDIETAGGGSARCMIAEIFLPEG